MSNVSVTSGGRFTAWLDYDEMFTDHVVTVYGSLKKASNLPALRGKSFLWEKRLLLIPV